MTAPALPVIGVVSTPNSAWRGGMKHTVVMDGASLASSYDRESAQLAVEVARLAIARAAIAAHVAPPVSASFDAALAGLDVENDYAPDRGTTYAITGIDDVRAAHAEAVRVAVEAEREACAKEALVDRGPHGNPPPEWHENAERVGSVEVVRVTVRMTRDEIADAIRARGAKS